MTGAVINKSNSTIQVHMQRIDKPEPVQGDLADYRASQTAVVGGGSSADIGIENAGKYIYTAVWSADSRSGSPSSWVIFDTANGSIIKSYIGGYTIDISGRINNWVITVGASWLRTIYIIIGTVAGLILVAIIFLILYFWLRRGSTSVENDLPIFIG